MKFYLTFTGIILFLLNSLHLTAQNLPDISGTWYSNGVLSAPAKITQNGNQLTFSYNQSYSTGYFSGPNQIYALEWNAAANIEADGQTITWSNQVWKRNAGQQTYPDISGTWYMNGDASIPCQITQNGVNLSFSFSNGHADGYYYEATKIYAKDWNAYGEVSQDRQEIIWNDQKWKRSPTTNQITQGAHKYCRFELSSFYFAAQLLGTVWGRSATEPLMPTAEAILQMEASLTTALTVYTSEAYSHFDQCLGYSVSRLQKLHDNLHSMSSDQIRQEIEGIIKELQVIISNASFSCDNGVNPLALYVAGVHLGAAQAWASAQQCRPAPMPASIASVIAAHLSTASSALSPYASCLNAQESKGSLAPAFDFGNFTAVPLTSMNSIAAHTFIVGTETQLLWAIALSPCCCNCNGKGIQNNTNNNSTSDCDATCKEYCRKQGYQNGRFNGKTICLLGQVSGGMHEGCDCGN